MKKLLFNLALLIALSTFNTVDTLASHFNGYEVSFNHISGKTYEFNLEFYDFAASPPDSVSFNVYSTCGAQGSFYVYSLMNTTQLPPLCSQNSVPLSKSSFSGTYTFPNNGCSDFQIILNINNSNSYSNVQSSGYNKSIFIYNVGITSNNSPKILNDPKYLIISNRTNTFNLHAIDPDGDSVVYKLASSSGRFLNGYTTQSPFGITQLCTLDSTTGILHASMSTGPILINIEIEEYRNQTLLSKTHREWSIYGLNSTPNPISISEINYNQGYDTTYCMTDTVNFAFTSMFNNTPIPTELDSNLYGAKITTTNGINYFKLLPSNLLKQNTPYHFYINATNDCDSKTQLFTIRFDSCITTSIPERGLSNFKLYPNPTQGKFTIDLDNENINTTISIRSITGQLIKELVVTNNQQNFDLSELENGIYFVSIATEGGIETKKIILAN